MPARCWTWLPGSQQAPPEYAEVPPSRAVFSTTTVASPAFWARKAPVIAPPPEPTTTTSYSRASVMAAILEQVLGGRWLRCERSDPRNHRAQWISHDRAPDRLPPGAAGHPAPR